MKRFNKILCWYSGKEDLNGLMQAAALAKLNKAELTLVDVVGELPAECQLDESEKWNKFNSTKKKQCGLFLENEAVKLRKKGIRVKTNVLQGIPAIRLIQEVIKTNQDLIIATAKAQKSLPSLLWGGVVKKLIRKSPVPVWVVKSGQQRLFKNIVVAVDPDSKDKVKTQLNKTIIELGRSLAERNKGTLTILHAWHPDTDFLITHGHTPLKQKDITALEKALQSVRKEELKALAGPFSQMDKTIKIKLVKGRPAKMIAQTTKRMKADLVVMGTVNRTGIAGFLLGSTLEDTMDELKCSLLAVKPKGFKTPVKLK